MRPNVQPFHPHAAGERAVSASGACAMVSADPAKVL